MSEQQAGTPDPAGDYWAQMAEDAEEILKGKGKRDWKGAALIKLMRDEVEQALGDVDRAEVRGARVRVETIEAYGLRIELDAHGRAVAVSSDDGFHVE